MSRSTNHSSEHLQPCVFFDRDGVLNQVTIRDGKAYSPRAYADFVLTPSAGGVVQAVKKLGFLAIVVTNQPDIARGLMARTELDRMHDWLRCRVPVDHILCCPHDDADACQCRKPLPGMLLGAAHTWGVDLTSSFLIGDSWKDMEAGQAAGVTTILLQRPDNQQAKADHRLDDLADLPQLLLTLNNRHTGVTSP